ncbi:hypothetical protein [Brevundimonas bullata]|uniref:hypothetical protein n=1 Tax=Brevundimonas bullata TaxID=13160 RepID=UPI0019B931C4|nr:hypothetical protein [Brevundimonas sp.]
MGRSDVGHRWIIARAERIGNTSLWAGYRREVRAAGGGPATDFFLTRTEREVSTERPDAWRLYRLHDLAAAPALFQLKPPLEAAVTLTAETWRAGF